MVIGRRRSACRRDRALDCVFGYACGLDMTRRDLQFAAREQRRPVGSRQGRRAVGGAVRDRSGHRDRSSRRRSDRAARQRQIKQRADISQLIHKVPEVIAHLSTFYHLHPGDLIYTGTPEGVGPVNAGDVLEGTIAGVGTIALTIGPAE